MEQIISIKRDKVLTKQSTPTFQVAVEHVTNPYKVQAFIDYGKSQDGPWVSVGFNDTRFTLGYLPKATASERNPA